MSKTKKRILSVIIALVMALSLLPTTFETAQAASYKIWVDNVEITDNNKDDVLNDGGKVKYNSKTNTLTINKVVTVSETFLSTTKEELKINGSCVITLTDSNIYGIYSKGKVVILDGADITFIGKSNIICAGELEINKAKVAATSKNVYPVGSGVISDKITLNGGRLKVSSEDYGIRGKSDIDSGTITINNGGNLYAANSSYDGDYKAAINVGSISVNKGKLEAKSPGRAISEKTVVSFASGYGYTINETTHKIIEDTFGVDKCMLSFDRNGGSGYIGPVYVIKGNTYTLPNCGFEAPGGKRFKCWQVNGTEYNPGKKITINENTTLVAQWEDNQYTITFDAGEGTGTLAPVYVTNGNNYTVGKPTTSFTAPGGKEFDCWQIDNTTDTCYPGDVITITKNTKLTAKWRETTGIELCEVSFDSNGGGGTIGSVNVRKGSKYLLGQNGFTPPTDNTFKCWEVNDTEYNPGETVTINSNTTIKALWQAPQSYTITFDGNGHGGTTIPAPKTIQEGKDLFAVMLSAIPSEDGYSFLNWYEDAECTKVFPEKMPARDVKLYAKWAQYVKDVKITGFKEPVAGEYATELSNLNIPDDAKFVITDITWLDEKNTALTLPFQFEAGKKYRAKITIKPKTGCEFKPKSSYDPVMFVNKAFDTHTLNGKDDLFVGNLDPYDTHICGLYTDYMEAVEHESYNIIEGADQTISADSTEDVVIKSDGEYEDFIYATIDETPVNPADYDVEKGSTILTLPNSYLKTLSPGTHTLSMNYINGKSASTTLTITGNGNNGNTGANTTEGKESGSTSTGANSDSPKMGDNSSMTALGLLILISGLGMVAVVYVDRKKKLFGRR